MSVASRKRVREEETVEDLGSAINTISIGKRVRFTDVPKEEKVFDESPAGSEAYTTIDGKKEGDCVSWYPTGQMKERATFRAGLEDGLVQQWYPGGRPFIVYTCMEGRRQGAAFRFYSNGTVCAHETYRDDKEDGLATYYYESGARQMDILFSMGRVIFVRHFDPP